MALPRVGGIIQSTGGLNKTRRRRQVELALCLTALGRTLISRPWCSWPSCLEFWTGIYTISSLALRPYTTPAAFLGLQFAEGRLWDLFYSHMRQYLIIYLFLCKYICVSLYFIGSVSLENPD